MRLTFRDLWSVINPKGWLEDAAINAILYYLLKKKPIGFIDTTVLQAIESPFMTEDTPTPFKDDKDGYVAVKNLGGDHWIFVYVCLKDKTVYVVDPSHNDPVPEAEQILKSFRKNHHNERNSKGESKWDFTDDEWETGTIEHILQKDSCNCGIFCIKFATELLHCSPTTPSEFTVIGHNNMDRVRQHYAAMLLRKSEKLEPEIVENDEDIPDENNDVDEHRPAKGEEKLSKAEPSKDNSGKEKQFSPQQYKVPKQIPPSFAPLSNENESDEKSCGRFPSETTKLPETKEANETKNLKRISDFKEEEDDSQKKVQKPM